MPKSTSQKLKSYNKIIASATVLFSTKGFDQVSIDDLMENAGLTRGAFYTYFSSKPNVYAKAIITGVKLGQLSEKKPLGLNQREWIELLINDFLSLAHIKQEQEPSALAFLITDISNNEVEVKYAYMLSYKKLNKTLYKEISILTAELGTPHVSLASIYSITAMMIGCVVVGRAVQNDEITTGLLAQSRKNIFTLLNLN